MTISPKWEILAGREVTRSGERTQGKYLGVSKNKTRRNSTPKSHDREHLQQQPELPQPEGTEGLRGETEEPGAGGEMEEEVSSPVNGGEKRRAGEQEDDRGGGWAQGRSDWNSSDWHQTLVGRPNENQWNSFG
jgi:hypothetical protein